MCKVYKNVHCSWKSHKAILNKYNFCVYFKLTQKTFKCETDNSDIPCVYILFELGALRICNPLGP